MNESLLNHLFLPHYLPSSADNDFLIQQNHQHEHKLLDSMNEYLNSVKWPDAPAILSVIRILIDCGERWSHLQNFQNFNVLNIQSTIAQLEPGSFLPLYFHAQNAAILIEIDENNINQALISAWQVLLPCEEITSSLMPNLSYFPVTKYRLYDRSQLNTKVHCELLMDFMFNTIEYSKSYKSSCKFDEIREVPESHYVCQWWIQHFNGIDIETESNQSTQFTKKHRDQVRWNQALLPFRRSGLWMIIKTVFHTILVKHLGQFGTIVYKLLITQFLTHIICTRHFSISTDFLVHCIRKIVRRLNKIDDLLLPMDSNDMNQWIQHTKQEIQMNIDKILSKLNWQKSNKKSEKKSQISSWNNIKLNDFEICQHSCVQFKAYLNHVNSNQVSGSFSDVKNHDVFTNVNQEDYIPSYDILVNEMNYTFVTALTHIDIWVLSRLEQWINRPSLLVSGKNRFELLLRFFEEYQSEALRYYWPDNGPTDPMNYSRFILTSLTIIRCMHKKLCQDKRFERLKLHSIHIPNLLHLFEYLILPNREDMIMARDLYLFFTEFNNKPYPDLLDNIESEEAFGVYFADHSSEMNNNIQRIQIQAEQDKQNKIIEVNNAKQRYMQLMTIVDNSFCESTTNHHNKKCKRCKTQKQAKKIQVKIYECPMPLARESALAVIFELQMPIEIRCYRDIVWQFINRSKPQPENRMHEWLTVSPHGNKLKSFYTGPNDCKVRLVSSTKSITQTHYSTPPSIVSTPAQDFLFENSLQVQISPIKSITFEDECRVLTPQLDHPDYKQLQFTVGTTKFVQNHVIAQLPSYSSRLKPSQLIEFGSFRSGHHLQWWNLLTILEMDSLSFAEESVAILIIHSILQSGPWISNLRTSPNSWCPESHRQLLEDHFVDELLSRFDRHLNDCALNWQNELVLVVITMITMRVLTICNSTREDKVVNLAMKCRKTGEKWIDLISICIQNVSPSAFDEIENLRLKMVNVGISCILTFSTYPDRIRFLLSSNEHVVSLLKAATTVHDNIILSKNQSHMSIFMRNIMRFGERTLVMIQPTVAAFLQKTMYQSLNKFTTIYWAIAKRKGSMNGQWKKRTNAQYDGWYDCQYQSRCISINCIRGTFLIDGMTIGFLPEQIIFNELFVRVFGDHIFEVQAADSPHTYVTKHSYHGTGIVQYEFYFNDRTNHLVIKERYTQSNDMFQLIPHSCFETELPDMLVSNHSHWWNAKGQAIEFRPVHFKDIDFLNNKSYMLSLLTGYITTSGIGNTQMLVNQSSTFFQSLFNQYFIRLDDKPYIYMMREHLSHTDLMIHIYLSRLGISFQYNTRTSIITSHEYPDMRIDEQQWLGTLTGLTSGLLLSPLLVKSQTVEYYPYRKLIVPFGEIHREIAYNNADQIVTIQRSSSVSFLHQYFVFILNDRLRILQSTDSPIGWLYLALLHAMTSHPLPDEYTEMTGMERAFQLLNSAGCWSDQPFDSLSLNILGQIAAISPKVDYYPVHLTCMEKIDWNTNGLYYSMQHFGYYLIAKKLIQNSQQLNFIYSSSASTDMPKLFEGKVYNESLLKKLYWDYRDSYNPLARLSIKMEQNILCTLHTKSYQAAPKYCPDEINHTAVCPVDDMYKKGNIKLTDCSQQHWLPLSQWLNDENQLKNIWIGLLKRIHCLKISQFQHTKDEIERFEKLIDFFRYISRKLKTKTYYLQLLKTALKIPNPLMKIAKFPPFIEYFNMEEISPVKGRINLSSYYTSEIQNQILAEVENSWQNHRNYDNSNALVTFSEIAHINQLLMSWQNNRKLRLFLEYFENRISIVPIEKFHAKVLYYPQKFAAELIEDHHQICVKSGNRLIAQELLRSAAEKFHRPYSGHFDKAAVTFQTNNRQTIFPDQIFPSVNNEENPLKEIGNYFKNQLEESWKKLISDNQCRRVDVSIEEITESLNFLRNESTKSWNALVESITEFNKQLFDIGLTVRITPTTLITIFQQNVTKSNLTAAQFTLLGGILVCWTLEQQLERALHYAMHDQLEEFTKEISHIPHSNWIPSEHISWLILELEMNITIRDIQIDVARHMMQSVVTADNAKVENLVMQMNMGEGKTSIILPMLAVSLSSSDSRLVRIVVLKSLFPTNYQSLRYKLGGLLNRRIFPFSCRRDMNFNNEQINQIFTRLQHGLRNCDVTLTSPEDILSFDLLTIDKCRRNELNIGRSMLSVQRWLKTFARDVLDESDEILHVKYQLVYTVGGQQHVDGGADRWNTIQLVLHLVKKHAQDISNRFSEDVFYKPLERKSSFPQFRLQSHQPFSLLSQMIVDDWLNQRSYRYEDEKLIRPFILETNSSVEHLVTRFSQYDIERFLMFRGLLSSEVLLVALKKRYRVNYGVTPNPSFNRLMAVPFRAKDVAADRTEFGHPDVALVLTQLSYYYSGLNDSQLIQCFDRLSAKETDPASIYEQWILAEEQDQVPASIKQWKGVNLKDYQQRTHDLFPTLRYNMLVVNYFLNYFVFPREAKQFPHKIVSSAWDLSSSNRSNIITGFSGTNDTQLLLPIDIRQCDLPQLQKTDAIVVNNLLQPENESYQYLPINATSEHILNKIVNYKESINVILDIGALFIDGTNRDIAIKWLNQSNKNKIDYAIYFDSDSIVVCDRQLHHYRFETSPASERLDRCVFYLDEIHTRGTDFRFPSGFQAAVTLGNGLTKDRFVQACMRMRKLGKGHRLTFWSSTEVHQQIITLKKNSCIENQKGNSNNFIKLIDILRWVYENTQQSTWDGLHYWAAQSLSFQRKVSACQTIQWMNHQQEFTDKMLENFANECLEAEIIELKRMYGATRVLETVAKIYLARYRQCNHHLSKDIHRVVLKRLCEYGGTKLRLAQLLDEEQQRELEHELEEERQSPHPVPVKPQQPKLHEEIKRLFDINSKVMNLAQLPNVFRPLMYAFIGTTFFNNCQPDSWRLNFWVTTEFQHVIESRGESLNPFLRPPRWIVVYQNRHIIFISAFEANWLMGNLKSKMPSVTTLRLFLPRIKRVQSIFVNTPTLTIPPSIGLPSGTATFIIPIEWLTQLFVFNGTLYFETADEQKAYCQCLSLCPQPRNLVEVAAFEKGWIAVDGFVSSSKHRLYLSIEHAQFTLNPLTFAKQVIENRHNFHVPVSSHVGSIILNSYKLI
ncbi:unnamed protein product [Rotaria socialis]